MNKKILIASLVTLASVAGVVGTVGNAHKVDAATEKTIYLKISSEWASATAEYTGWVWGGSKSEYWVNFIDSDGDGILEGKVQSDNTDIIFLRSKPNSDAWADEWNRVQTKLPTDGKNQFNVSGWNSGSWGTYTYVEPSVYLAGSMNGWSTTTTKLIDDDKNKIYECELELEAGSYTFKIVKNGTWLGNTGKISDSVTGWTMTDAGDCTLVATGGKYLFSFDVTSNKLSVTHTPAVDYDSEVKSLLTEYYNNGSYTRNTTINLNNDSVNELSQYWHAGSDLLERTTYFKGGELWMTNDKGGYSYYGTKGSDTVYAKTETPSVTPENTYVAIKGKTMEQYYTTLADIKDNTAEWTKNGNVYSTNDETVVKMFLDFTAPCLYDVTEENNNYLSYNGVEVEETTEGLVLRLKATTLETGKLAVENGVLSTATITY